MKVFKKIISIMLCFAMTLNFVPVTNAAAEEETVQVDSSSESNSENAGEYNIWVGGVPVNEENSADVFGDGTVSFDVETRTLTLNGADVEGGYEYIEDALFGICSLGALNIVLEGEESKILSPECLESYGIYVGGNLSISGNGVLTVTGGSYSSEDASVKSTGILVVGLLSVNEATVIANGGEVASGDEYEATSAGIVVEGSILLDSKGTLTANAGNANGGEYAFSYGILAYAPGNTGRIEVYDGTLIANSSTAKSKFSSESIGILVNNCYFYSYEPTSRINIKSGDAIATVEDNPNYFAASAGIYAMGEVNFQSGKIDISTGFNSGEEINNSGVVVGGGYAILGSGEDGLGIDLNITTTNGVAFYTMHEIKIGENVIVTNPEEYVVGEMEGMEDVWTIFDKEGNVVKDVTIRSKKLLGDINEDEKINAQDALLALQHSAKIIELDENQMLVGNVNFDESINASDALEILKYAANIIDSF